MRYIIGIDLGTTNSCLAYVDTQDTKLSIQSFKIPQLISEGCIEALPTLPSFCYLSSPHEWPKEALNLPWAQQTGFFVGSFARQHGAKVPTRLVQSAKSWLCHSAANRRDKILPLTAADETLRISPVEATARYLRHLREAWNEVMAKNDPESDFDCQEIVLTVPASFDEVARSLTIEAARLAGFVQMTLLEEPQAAFYSWIAQHAARWEQVLKAGDCILVCDVGGGTTDFSLIDVVHREGKLSFQRMAVGDHLLLGGDNMDMAIAHYIESKLLENGREPSTLQRLQLLHEARKAKEKLLRSDKLKPEDELWSVILHGTGSSVVQSTLKVELNKNEIQELLLSGFFERYEWDEALKLHKTAGLRSMGLPYEDEPSITKHLANFLHECQLHEGGKMPDYVLFNGGAMKPAIFQKAVMDSLKKWFPEKKADVLQTFHLDLAVSRGAAYYGIARRGLGIKIRSGTARGYYIVVDAKDKEGKAVSKALTIVPRGSEEGCTFEPMMIFSLIPNTPVSFQIATSHVRLHDQAGDLVPIDPEEMHMLPPIHTALRYGKRQAQEEQEKIPVHLHIVQTSIGTLEISLKSLKTQHKWLLEFQLRSASGQDNSISFSGTPKVDQTFEKSFLKDAEEVILQVFGPARGALQPSSLMDRLEETLSLSRKDWPPSILRGLSEVVLKTSAARKLSTEYGERWWNLIGFLMRPGFGYPLDDFKMKELWKSILGDYKSPMPLEVKIQQWICFRRLSGGMNKGQQTQLANDLLASLFNAKNADKIEIKSKSDLYPYSEKMRALASMELIDAAIKIRLGNALTARILKKEAISSDYWALGRIGARHLLYGSLVNVVPQAVCEQWVEALLNPSIEKTEQLAFLLSQLGRRTGHRELNISNQCIEDILKAFQSTLYRERLEELLLKENHLTQSEQEQIFGDRLPAGLSIDI